MSIFYPLSSFIANTLKDLIFTILYVRTIRLDRFHSRTIPILAIVMLIAVRYLILYIDNYYYETIFFTLNASTGHALISFLRNAAVCLTILLYILILERLPFKVAAYDTLLICTVCVASHNIFLTPLTKPIVDVSLEFAENLFLNQLICFAILNGITITIYVIMYRSVRLSIIRHVEGFRFLLLFLLFLISVYFNGSIKSIEFIEKSFALPLSGYLVIVQLLLLLFIGYFERYQYVLETRSQLMLEEKTVNNLLQNIDQQKKNEDFVRRLNHDFKHHLGALRYLIANGKTQDASEYIDTLSDEFQSSSPVMISGNPVIDGIFAQKIDQINDHHISLSVSADFSCLEFMEPVDLCTLFGNLLDNAVESCINAKENPSFIRIRGRRVGDSVIFSMDNTCRADLHFSDEIPVTTKKDKQFHGIGLRSTQLAVEKYSGTIAFSAGNGIFHAICSFPLQEMT